MLQNQIEIMEYKKDKIYFAVPDLELDQDQLIGQITNNIDVDDIAKFIAKLEVTYEEWEVTIQLIQHFKALEKEFYEECPEEVILEPKKIEV